MLIWGHDRGKDNYLLPVWPLTLLYPCVRSSLFEERPLQCPEVATWIGQLLTIEPNRARCGHAWRHNSHRNVIEMNVWTGRVRIWIFLPQWCVCGLTLSTNIFSYIWRDIELCVRKKILNLSVVMKIIICFRNLKTEENFWKYFFHIQKNIKHYFCKWDIIYTTELINKCISLFHKKIL